MQDVAPGLPPQPVRLLVGSGRAGFPSRLGRFSEGETGAARPAPGSGQARRRGEPVWGRTGTAASTGVPAGGTTVLTVDNTRQPA